jgi:hypothetical protein
VHGEVEFLKDPLHGFLQRMTLARAVVLGGGVTIVPITIRGDNSPSTCVRVLDPNAEIDVRVDREPATKGPAPLWLSNNSNQSVLFLRGEQHVLNGGHWSVRRTELLPPGTSAPVLVGRVDPANGHRAPRASHEPSIPELVAREAVNLPIDPDLCGCVAFVNGCFAGLLCLKSPALADAELPVLLSEHVSDGPAPAATRPVDEQPLTATRQIFDLIGYATIETRRMRDCVGHVDFHAQGLDGHLVTLDGELITLSVAPTEIPGMAR